MGGKDNGGKSKRYIKRSLIQLGSSYAVTFPRGFLESFKDKNGELKGITVHCFKIDNDSILIRKYGPIREYYILTIDLSEFPIDLLEDLIICARKLNVGRVEISYTEDKYEDCLKILNNFDTPILTDGKMVIELGNSYSSFGFREQINGMIKNFGKIIELLTDEKINKPFDQIRESIDIYLKGITAGFNETLRLLILRLNNYYLGSCSFSGKTENGEDEQSLIINTLGNRVLIAKIKDMAQQASGLIPYRDKEEFKKYIGVISKFPQLLEKAIRLLLHENLHNKLDEISIYSGELKDIKNRFIDLIPPSNSEKYTVDEEVITRNIRFIFDSLMEIHELIITRWIESALEKEVAPDFD